MGVWNELIGFTLFLMGNIQFSSDFFEQINHKNWGSTVFSFSPSDKHDGGVIQQSNTEKK